MLCAYRVSDCGREAEAVKQEAAAGRFFFTPEGCNEIVRSLTLSHPESIVDVVARAETLMDGGDPSPQDPDASFVLARAYRYCGYQRFLERMEIATEHTLEPDRRARSSHDQDVMERAARLVSDLYALHLTAGSDHPVEDVLRRAVHTRCAHLTRARRKCSPPARVMVAGSVAMAAMTMPDLPSAEKRKDWGLATLCEIVGDYAYPTRPVSLGERTLVAEMYLSLVVLSQRPVSYTHLRAHET